MLFWSVTALYKTGCTGCRSSPETWLRKAVRKTSAPLLMAADYDITEEGLRQELLTGLATLLPYYRHVLGLPRYEQGTYVNAEKNMILCGPPGTGKTYNTAVCAVAFCDQRDPKDVAKQERCLTMLRYHELEKEGRIGFTTFHQSYSYEDFIEGIRPNLSNEAAKAKKIDKTTTPETKCQ